MIGGTSFFNTKSAFVTLMPLAFNPASNPLFVLNGKYGPYIKKGKANYKLPKGTVAEDLELKDCLEIIENQPKKTRGKRKSSK